MAKKILVIDDEELIIKTLSKLLEKNGYEVFIAKNGEDAVVMTEEEKFDLLIVDIRMPGLNGVETIERIYKMLNTRKQAKMPVIFISGYADEQIEKQIKKIAPVAYVHKPFDIESIIETIKKIIN